MIFSNDQSAHLNNLIRQLHQSTGIALTAAVSDRCDSYPEIPWKAFATTIVLNGLVQLFQLLFPPAYLHPWSAPQMIGFIIGSSAGVALLAMLWPSFGRLFLSRHRAETQVNLYAQALFLRRELFQWPERNALLLVVCTFEAQAVFLVDRGIDRIVTKTVLQPVLDRMLPLLRRQDCFQALFQGVTALEGALLAAGPPASHLAVPRRPEVGLVQLKSYDI
jgi:uncharacterized membrane protein